MSFIIILENTTLNMSYQEVKIEFLKRGDRE